MTKVIDPRPEPSSQSRYDSYLIPRSKTWQKTALYEKLLELGWRYDANMAQWHTPEDRSLQGFGRLEWAADFAWARVQPPTTRADLVRESPLIELRLIDDVWYLLGE